MTVASKDKIIGDIDAHVGDEGSGYAAWYVGITEDTDRRLFDEHKVPRGKGKAWRIARKASSSSVSREIEQHFLDLGMDGGGSGGDDDAVYVYAYKMTEDTDP